MKDLKAKLNDIIKSGKDYEYDVSSCIKALIITSDQDIVLLSIQAVSELVKCEEKREIYAHKDVIEPILKNLQKDVTVDNLELIKQCCRALGNLCCDCDNAREIILDCEGVSILITLFKKSIEMSLNEIKFLPCKLLLNYAIGGQKFSETLTQGGLIEVLDKILSEKTDFNDDMVSTVLLILSVINDNAPEFLYGEEVNRRVLNILKETSNIEISELCLEHLHTQAENGEEYSYYYFVKSHCCPTDKHRPLSIFSIPLWLILCLDRI